MKVFITKQSHGKYNYLLNWNNPETGGNDGRLVHDFKRIEGIYFRMERNSC